MSKFKVGDKVIRTEGRWGNSYAGSEHVVREVGKGSVGRSVTFEGDTMYTYSEDKYELIGDVLEEPAGV